MDKKEITAEVGMESLEGVLGCAEMVVCVDEEGQHCSLRFYTSEKAAAFSSQAGPVQPFQ